MVIWEVQGERGEVQGEALSSLMSQYSAQSTYQNTMAKIYQEMSESFMSSVDILLSIFT